ncbi:haloacid dehalogenase-like domain-containing protein [Chloropicon primus]|uniref:Haloacid dehalogenase-like domain-containing protein n=1 Tax=Chloropicon primus TaxID=1764295 RepID=A0A5B8MN04_9CHLO|nr:haloacid dehalogenase-like domain-containing protein [Chloropicon primus]UPR00206.1 haloacid dehalogenase-like domain-containing protein [Chloropicon primus]|eukprot:QDZ20995.1 haloacid dehalogenase-like domain-containing protein [Chloropicon primus]
MWLRGPHEIRAPFLMQQLRKLAMVGTGGGRRGVRGVIFDMDGTLTIPCLDFVKMRRRAGEALGRDIGRGDMLAEVAKEECEEKRAAALRAIKEVEREGHEKMKLARDVSAVCSFLDERNIPRAILTRNSRESLDYFHDRLPNIPEFAPAVSRDCGFRPKPHPDALKHISENVWGFSPTEVIMIGDSAKDDVRAGKRAGAITVLLGDEIRREDLPDEEHEPHFRIKDLSEFKQLVLDNFELVPESLESLEVGQEK